MRPPAHTARFRAQLAAAAPPGPAPNEWVFVPYDQLTSAIGPLAARGARRRLGIVMLESLWKGHRRRYHKQKLALVVANMRHFALEHAAAGWHVHYAFVDTPYAEALGRLRTRLGAITCMEPAERELRLDLGDTLPQVPHAGWLSTPEDFRRAGGPPYRMDRFYRHMRQKTGLLMTAGKPDGGKYSHDADNRRRWPGAPAAPAALTFRPDDITQEACAWVTHHFPDNPGTLDPLALPATARDAARAWAWAKRHCLTHFGPFEDAMSASSRSLFHTRISALMNLHRLLPADVVGEAAELPLPLSSKEGFVRQILGWREFVRHVHRETHGLTEVPTQNFFAAKDPLPAAFWGDKSGLRCLDAVIGGVWEEGYGHHITRLMVICNLATLLDLDPRAVTDWFWVAYTDAYDWVVEPNVLGMGTFALGDLMMTKPYVCGAGYIDKMSDYCAGCRFDPKKTCPITPMYWAFLARHRGKLAGNHRMSIVLKALSRRAPAAQRRDREIWQRAREGLQAGRPLEPDAF